MATVLLRSGVFQLLEAKLQNMANVGLVQACNLNLPQIRNQLLDYVV